MTPLRGVAAGVLIAAMAGTAFAQSYTVRPFRGGRLPAAPPAAAGEERREPSSEVTVELIFDARFGAGLHAQEWSQTFQQLGVPVRIRRAVAGDEPDVKETTLGTQRRVTVVGRLDRSGDLIFPERRYSRNQAGKLSDWLKELQTYGAQGAPAGQPVWGLDKVQFEALYSALSRTVESELEGLPLEQATVRIGLPATYPLRFTAKAGDWLAREYPGDPQFRQSLKGFSTGTALAIVLGDYGLGFRPQRQPDGSIELTVDPLKDAADVWPVGWEPKDSRQKTFPALYELVPVELDDVKLLDVLGAVSIKTDVPVRFDHYRIEASGIKLDEIVVRYPSRKTSWSLLLRGVTNPHQLTRELKIDERGTPFVWITTLKIGRLGRPEREEQ
ncbi:MAG TPA: hypothetical protein VML55_17385 [Planctomycetaceae bacterium]|nr:hypothetical protein [Planctomycetaceae bacterium]